MSNINFLNIFFYKIYNIYFIYHFLILEKLNIRSNGLNFGGFLIDKLQKKQV